MRLSLFVLLMVVLAVTLCEGDEEKKCRYSFRPWSACKNGRKTKELTLRPGSSKGCLTKRTIGTRCSTNTPTNPADRPKCYYTGGARVPCIKGYMKRKFTLKAGSNARCRAVRYKRERCGSSAPSKCRYSSGPWSACKNGHRTKKMTLRPGSSKGCVTKRTIRARCSTNTPTNRAGRPKCYYTGGARSPCIKGNRKRKFTLKAGSDAKCRTVRYKRERCGSFVPTKCMYRNSSWTRCENGIRKNRMRLVRLKSRPNCPRFRIVKKRC